MEDRPSILRELKICRFCLTEKEPLTNIYEKDKNSTIPLPLQIMACCALEVFANDGMPQLICDNCRIQTKKSYSFKQICKRSDDALKLYLATGVLKRGNKEIEIKKSTKRKTTSDNSKITAKKKKIEVNSDTEKNIIENVPSETDQVQNEDENIENVEKSEEIEQTVITEEEILDEVCIESNQIVEEVVQTNEPEEIKNNNEIIESESVIESTDIESVEQSEDIESVTKVPQVQTQCFACSCCERSFPLQQLLEIHMRQHTRERKFNCNECGKKFFSKHDLAKHVQTHTGDKPYSCVICDKSFSRATPLHRHEKIHISVPKYLCTYCDKTYLNSDDLDTHMRIHKKNRPFQCTQCDKRFAFKQGLERHEITHSTENSHKCNYCEESFSTPSKLRRHITCHAGARPYPCKLCPRTFLLSHHLTRHLRNHYNQRNKNEEGGEYKCDVCSMSFKKKLSLVNHAAIHSMVNLKCVICNKEFEDALTVREHITTHLSGLPFFCYKCDYSFENENDLMEHEQKHVNDYDSENDVPETTSNIKQEISENEELVHIRRSMREKKAKNFVDFLQDGEFSDTDENTADVEEHKPTLTKLNPGSIQPVVRSETVKVYKGVKDKSNIKTPEIISTPMSTKRDETAQQNAEFSKETKKSLTKITTLENLGLSKSALEAMTDKSGFVEMKIGQKVIRVQKLMMTKAEVQAMAKEGKIEMKGTKVVVKNTGDGILDINKIANIGKNSPVNIREELISESSMGGPQITAIREVRTYVKKLSRKDEMSVDNVEILENENVICKEYETAENIDIDLKSNTNEEETSIVLD